MKDHDILNAVGDIDEKFIKKAADTPAIKQRNNRFKPIAAIAACICFVLVGIAVLGPLSHLIKEPKSNGDHSGEDGVYIPAVKLPESSETEAADMIGFVVYKGHIYTHTETYSGDEARQKIDALVGDHLGTAKGNIDEWSTQDEYATEFASSISGEVYSVKGYDTSFRICVSTQFEDEYHNKIYWIEFLDCLNDITLKTGSDLFEDRLHISGNIDSIKWQSHYDWDYNGENYNIRSADIDPDLWARFMDQVDKCDFVNTWYSDNTIYDTQNQAHIILEMKDGTVVRLRLIEGGYVGYSGLAWCFVKIPEDVFSAVYDACGGTHQ